MWGIDLESAGLGLLVGMLLGRWWAGWAVWGYVKSKRPDKAGFRTGIHMGDGMYYIATGEEYSAMMTKDWEDLIANYRKSQLKERLGYPHE